MTVVFPINLSKEHRITNGMQALTESDLLPFEVGLEVIALLLVVVAYAFVGKVTIEGQKNCFALHALTFVIA